MDVPENDAVTGSHCRQNWIENGAITGGATRVGVQTASNQQHEPGRGYPPSATPTRERMRYLEAGASVLISNDVRPGHCHRNSGSEES